MLTQWRKRCVKEKDRNGNGEKNDESNKNDMRKKDGKKDEYKIKIK